MHNSERTPVQAVVLTLTLTLPNPDPNPESAPPSTPWRQGSSG
jgi:hypothetical protein